MKPLILASASPYRKQLLQRIGLDFRCLPADLDESPEPGESAARLAARLARAKAARVASLAPEALVIGSDQVAELGQQMLGKPGDHANATRQLRAASGKQVHFHTAVCLLADGFTRVHTDLTTVRFRQLEDAQIERYLLRERPYDCAGSFKAEGLGIALFAGIDSTDPTALMGLPMIWLCQQLLQQGYPVL